MAGDFYLGQGIPSQDTFARLEPLVFEARFQDWIRLIARQLGAELIALDGKTLRGSYDREQGLQALQLVSGWCCWASVPWMHSP